MKKAKELLREAVCLALSLVLSWWIFLRPSEEPTGIARLDAPPQALLMELTPLVAAEAALAELAAAQESRGLQAAPAAEVEVPPARVEEPAPKIADRAVHREEPPASAPPPMPPPPELGTPEGEPREPSARAPEPEPREPAGEASAGEGQSETAGARTPPSAAPRGSEDAAAPVASEESRAEPPPAAAPEPPVLELPAAQPVPVARQSEPSPTKSASAATPEAGAPSSEEGPRAQQVRDGPRDVSALMRDPTLLAAADAEIAGEERRGFATVLLAAPEDQLAIARFFGEELVLVPREALDPEASEPHWFRVATGSAQVEEVHGRAPLEGYRQYRDLFDYDYSRLPDAVRELRRRSASRRDVYVFAALIPAREWAVVVARRGEALARSGRELAEVRRFVLRYLELAEGAFDLTVDHIVFADGSRYPPHSAAEKGTRTQ